MAGRCRPFDINKPGSSSPRMKDLRQALVGLAEARILKHNFERSLHPSGNIPKMGIDQRLAEGR